MVRISLNFRFSSRIVGRAFLIVSVGKVTSFTPFSLFS